MITFNSWNWLGHQIVAADRFVISNNIATVKVIPGDDPIGSSGNRNEYHTPLDSNNNEINENESSGTQYYGVSFKLDSTWDIQSNTDGYYCSVVQLHSADLPDFPAQGPPFSVRLEDAMGVYVYSGNLDDPGHTNDKYLLSDSSLPKNKWIDLILKINYAKTNTGEIKVWRRDEGVSSFTQVLNLSSISTLLYSNTYPTVMDHYWKCGIYCNTQYQTNILQLKTFKRADSYAEIENLINDTTMIKFYGKKASTN